MGNSFFKNTNSATLPKTKARKLWVILVANIRYGANNSDLYYDKNVLLEEVYNLNCKLQNVQLDKIIEKFKFSVPNGNYIVPYSNNYLALCHNQEIAFFSHKNPKIVIQDHCDMTPIIIFYSDIDETELRNIIKNAHNCKGYAQYAELLENKRVVEII